MTHREDSIEFRQEEKEQQREQEKQWITWQGHVQKEAELQGVNDKIMLPKVHGMQESDLQQRLKELERQQDILQRKLAKAQKELQEEKKKSERVQQHIAGDKRNPGDDWEPKVYTEAMILAIDRKDHMRILQQRQHQQERQQNNHNAGRKRKPPDWTTKDTEAMIIEIDNNASTKRAHTI